MFFARIRPAWLFLLMLLPVLASVIFGQLAEHNDVKHIRYLVLSINLSTFFAMIFVCWVATLVYVLAPSFRSKFLLLFGVAISVLFRLWQDNFTLDVVNITGHIPRLAFISLYSPVFVMHVLVSVFIIFLLIMLGSWLVKKEKELGLAQASKVKTMLWFIIFPIGMWFIQPRMRKIMDMLDAE